MHTAKRERGEKKSVLVLDSLLPSPTLLGAILQASHPPVSVEHCEVGDEDGESVWTFERVGPFHSRGASWLSAGWRDAGRFAAALAEPTAGPLSVSAYGLRP